MSFQPCPFNLWFILAALLLLLTVGAELGVRSWNASKGSVRIVNQGESTMDEVIVTYGRTRVAVGTLAAGQSSNVWLTAAGKGTLSLDFKQKGNRSMASRSRTSTQLKTSPMV